MNLLSQPPSWPLPPMPSWLRILAVLTLLAVSGCEEQPAEPWNDAQMEDMFDYLGEVAKAYALVDICMPMIEEDPAAKHELVSAIEVDRYARLLQFDTSFELKRLLAHLRNKGGTSEQNLALRLHYEAARRGAETEITSVQVCVDTIKDYANTIIYMRVR